MFEKSERFEYGSLIENTWAPVYNFSSEFVEVNARNFIIDNVQGQSNDRAAHWNADGSIQRSKSEHKRPVICKIPIGDKLLQSILG